MAPHTTRRFAFAECPLYIIDMFVYIIYMDSFTTELSARISTLRLSHGQAIQVLRDTRLAESVSASALDAMIKKLRREGVPFAADELGDYQWEEIVYRYEHIIELAVALKMQSDGMSFRHVVALLTKYRNKLRKFYREALLEARSGRGADHSLKNSAQEPGELAQIKISGLYLDFRATYHNGVIGSPGPELLGPWKALERFMAYYDGLYPMPLIMLSQICERVFRIAEATPPVKRGRKA